MTVEAAVTLPQPRLPFLGRRVAAAFLSLLCPGAGHVFMGRWRSGAGWVLSLVAIASSLPFVGFVGVVMLLSMAVVAAVDAVRLAPARQGVPSLGRAVAMGAVAWLVGILALSLLRACVVSNWHVPSGSMEPSILSGDVLMADGSVGPPLQRRPVRRGEVLVFSAPHAANAPFITRVVALAGDTVRVEKGTLWLNGSPVPRRSTAEPCTAGAVPLPGADCAVSEELLDGVAYRIQGGGEEPSTPDAEGMCPPLLVRAGADCKVPSGHLFVLGDSRANSHDSRSYGAVPESNVLAVGSYVYFSWSTEAGVRTERLGLWLR
ncbi:signal peptidase I [Myxococcus stipitatus DSM 14675]|uniref:Signal peptidase I n=1 Tax=Myxococcus stipitatus (strain DSM 14675 / JCM 12634 / Mx s8) TaxID=1278073 RepID=L7U803_MYXSD|nr:signal peptidase I [Myxococcus stipitatus]AGC43717.1 signal peptidase I [Myxococcus stipitatus DSM 14675]